MFTTRLTKTSATLAFNRLNLDTLMLSASSKCVLAASYTLIAIGSASSTALRNNLSFLASRQSGSDGL